MTFLGAKRVLHLGDQNGHFEEAGRLVKYYNLARWSELSIPLFFNGRKYMDINGSLG